MRTIIILCIIYFSFIQAESAAQIKKDSLKFNPYNIDLISKELIPTIEMPPFDLQSELEKNIGSSHSFEKSFHFAKVFNVNIDLKKDARFIESNKYNRWIIGIKSKDAFSVGVTFTKYLVPPESELYIYNTNRTKLIGAFTNLNNSESEMLPIFPIEGESIVIDYIEPKNVEFSGLLIIGIVCHDYVNIFQDRDKDAWYGSSGQCEVDINCSTGYSWQVEKYAVCRIYNGYTGVMCSGFLINNVNNDGTPYVLTANHCISTSLHAGTSAFWFDYESPSCNGGDGIASDYIYSSTLRATWAYDLQTHRGSDFTLVELSNPPDEYYHPYYAGWNRENTAATGGICIHHPKGDVKKIAVENNTLISTYHLSENNDANADHWRVIDWDIGVTEVGSSGSPLFNEDHKVVGQLHGGYADCNGQYDNNLSDWFGKIYSSWTGGGSSSSRLRDWLDSNNTTTELPGLRLVKDATINSDTPCFGDIVKFENVSVQASSDIEVDFQNSFEASGTFSAPSGTTLYIHP
ncbi:MAG: trypsin-like peptidase domain-containing protein [Clostridiaceae bacterium]|nr:trypsin-like peptidase domain-containing protein [Clostridiaceae bacterium]